MDNTTRMSVAVQPEELRKADAGRGLHQGVDEKLDAVLGPHPPLQFSKARDQDQFEIDPVGIDPLINLFVGFDPIAVYVAGIGFVSAEATVDENISNTGLPESRHGFSQPSQQPTAPGRGIEPLCDLSHRRGMIAGRQGPGEIAEFRYHS